MVIIDKKNSQTYTYWAFGINLTSEIEFPELQPASFEIADVELYIANVIDIAGENSSNGDFTYTLNSTQLLFEVKDVAKFIAQNGNTIIIQPDAALKEMRLIRLYILATVFAAILLQRKQLPLHASAILHHNELILICGDSGAGKSTTLAGLIKNGHTVFSDDVVVIDQLLRASASYPMIKLWNDAQEKLNDNLFVDKSFIIKPGMDKYGIFFHQTFNTRHYPVKKILILKKGDVQKINSDQAKASAAFVELEKQVYRSFLINTDALKALKFSIISSLANTCTIYQVTRPVVCDIKNLLSFIENLIFDEK